MQSRSEHQWRLLDTGIRPAAENFAMNRAILEAHRQGLAPHTLRFLGFRPSALIGFHQDVAQELNLDFIHEHGIEIQRRLSGGGAIYFDEQQFGWELYLDRRLLGVSDMGQIAERICNTVAAALQGMGVNARFRPRNDIEVEGRKISGSGGYFDGNSFLYHGTVLVEFDVEKMLRILRIPVAKISDKAIKDARQRTTSIREILGEETPPMEAIKQGLADAVAREFGIEWQRETGLNTVEQAAYQEALEEIDSEEWVFQHNRPADAAPMQESMFRCAGGLLKCCVILDPQRERLKQLWITGDFFIKPTRLIADLEAALRNTRIADLDQQLEAFFSAHDAELLMLSAGDFAAVIRLAIEAAAGGGDVEHE